MRNSVLVLAVALGLMFVGAAEAQSIDDQIAHAVRPLPEDLRAGATVYTYAPDTGERKVLREGTNHVECRTRNNNGYTRCYPTVTASRRDLMAKLRAEGKSDEEVQAALASATEAGTIESTPFGSMHYRLYEKDDKIRLLWVVHLPGAKAEDLGLSTVSQSDNAKAGKGRPWMMREGTPGAHLMIPINATELSNKGGAVTRMNSKSIDDKVAQAVLPLPEDLRAGATVVTYDSEGERKVLREGTNHVECQPRNNIGYTRCYPTVTASHRYLADKLRAEGKSGEERQAALAAAREAGTIKPRPFGSVTYRLYEEDDGIKLLWVMWLPNGTSEELGMSTASQGAPSRAGEGLPWMMREGTPGAHLMIPINATELSNPR